MRVCPWGFSRMKSVRESERATWLMRSGAISRSSTPLRSWARQRRRSFPSCLAQTSFWVRPLRFSYKYFESGSCCGSGWSLAVKAGRSIKSLSVNQEVQVRRRFSMRAPMPLRRPSSGAAARASRLVSYSLSFATVRNNSLKNGGSTCALRL